MAGVRGTIRGRTADGDTDTRGTLDMLSFAEATLLHELPISSPIGTNTSKSVGQQRKRPTVMTFFLLQYSRSFDCKTLGR